MTDQIAEMFNQAERAAHTTTTFGDFQNKAKLYPHGLIRIRSLRTKGLLGGSSVATEMVLYEDRYGDIEVGYFKAHLSLCLNINPDLLTSSVELSTIQRVHDLQLLLHNAGPNHESPKIEYETPEGVVLDLQRPIDAQKMTTIQQGLRHQGAITLR